MGYSLALPVKKKMIRSHAVFPRLACKEYREETIAAGCGGAGTPRKKLYEREPHIIIK
jgi:hypothetical protein